MAKRTAKSRPEKQSGKRTAQRQPRDTGENRTADAATIAWTVSATTVLLCNLAAAFAYLVARSRPVTKGAFVMADLLVVAGAIVGLATLALTPVVYRIRRVPPPTGVTVFAVCAAAAPILALRVRALR